MISFDIHKSLEQLENNYWPDGDFYPTPLVERCYQYRKIPVSQLTIEQLRTLLLQQMGSEFLVPIAIQKLKSNILAEGDLYAGDLLNAVLSQNKDYWKSDKELWSELVALIDKNLNKIERQFSMKKFNKEFTAFKEIWQ